jgi:glycosyltransferase involved in cell wall biosynthesis
MDEEPAMYEVGIFCAGQQIGGAEVICLDLAEWLHRRGVKTWLHLGHGGRPQIRQRLVDLTVEVIPHEKIGAYVSQTHTLFVYGTKLIGQNELLARSLNRAERIMAFVGGFNPDYVDAEHLQVDTYLAECSAVPHYFQMVHDVWNWEICRIPMPLWLFEQTIYPWGGVGDDVFVFGVMSRMNPRKQVGHVLQAFWKLWPRCPVALVVVGDGAKRKALMQMSADDERIMFLGLVENRQRQLELLRRFDVLVSPSQWEACSRVIREAMWIGTPVIATDGHVSSPRRVKWGDGTRELLVHRRSALIRDSAGDLSALCHQMSMALNTPLMTRIANQARADAEVMDSRDGERLLRILLD